MNLYQVFYSSYDWGCFVFDVSRNRAKMRVAHHFGFDYVDARCKTLKKGINLRLPMIVDSDMDEGYNLVLRLGFHYTDEYGEEI